MRVIDLLNKIANGKDIPKKIKYNNTDYYFYDRYTYLRTDKSRFFDSIYFKELNDEVEIIEYEYKSLTSEKMEVAKQLHKTNSWFLMKLITLCLKLNGIKYDVVIK